MKRFLGCLLAATVLFSACRSAPEAIVVGEDHCDLCHMQIADARFGAEVITEKGRVMKFDSVSCLAGYLASNHPAQVLVSDFLHPGKLIPVERAQFLRMKKMNGPMGPAVVASEDENGLRQLQESQEGEKVTWAEYLHSAQ